MPTTVALSATCTINGNKVILNAGDMTKLGTSGLTFSITQPTPLGTPSDFTDWFYKTFGTKLDLPDDKNLPAALKGPYNAFKNGQVVLDTMVVNQPAQFYQFGLSFQLAGGVSIISGLAIDGIGVLVTKQLTYSPLAKDLATTDTTVQVKAGDGPLFQKAAKIQIEQELMPVTKIEGDTLTVTRAAAPVPHSAGVMVSIVDA